jgi:polar amino acid transport system substrate-binding protein
VNAHNPHLNRRLALWTILIAASIAGAAAAAAHSSPLAADRAQTNSLVSPHTLTICSDIPAPPFEQYDQHQHLTGFDVNVVDAIASRMQLRTTWVNSVFDTIFEALQGGKCDMIATSMYILPSRLKQIAMLPYFTAGESFLVTGGNPRHFPVDAVAKPLELCGLKIAVQLGSAEASDAKTFNTHCKHAGKPSITIINATKTTDALQQLQSGFADAFFYDSPSNSYYANVLSRGKFEVAGGVRSAVPYGFGFIKGRNPLLSTFTKNLKAIEGNGTYTRLLKRWGLQGTAIPKPIPEQ